MSYGAMIAKYDGVGRARPGWSSSCLVGQGGAMLLGWCVRSSVYLGWCSYSPVLLFQ